MNLKSIAYFLCVAEELNITRAAERLFISQQALSSHIKRLEETYQVRLFERYPTLHLTPEGQELVFYGHQLLNTEANMKAAFFDISKTGRATLRIGFSRLRSSVFFPLIWKFYQPHHPNISVELFNGNSAILDEYLQAGSISSYIGVDVPHSPNETQIELAQEKIQCCFSEELLARHYPDSWQMLLQSFTAQSAVDLTKIIKLPFLTLRSGNRLRRSIDHFFANFAKPYYALECEQQRLIYEYALEGQGAGLLSPVICYQQRHNLKHSKQFHVFPVLNDIPVNTVSLVYRNDFEHPQYMRDFIDDTCLVMKNYSRSIQLHFQSDSVHLDV